MKRLMNCLILLSIAARNQSRLHPPGKRREHYIRPRLDRGSLARGDLQRYSIPHVEVLSLEARGVDSAGDEEDDLPLSPELANAKKAAPAAALRPDAGDTGVTDDPDLPLCEEDESPK